MRPWEAVRSARFSAFAMPALRSASTAFSRSPAVSASAFLHSIMPAPVMSRSCLTCSAVIVMALPCSLERPPAATRGRARGNRDRVVSGARGNPADFGLGRVAAERDGLLVGALERDGPRLEHRVRDHPREQFDGAQRVVVA